MKLRCVSELKCVSNKACPGGRERKLHTPLLTTSQRSSCTPPEGQDEVKAPMPLRALTVTGPTLL